MLGYSYLDASMPPEVDDENTADDMMSLLPNADTPRGVSSVEATKLAADAGRTLLYPPISIPRSEVASLWRELLTSLLEWITVMDFSLPTSLGEDEAHMFKSIQKLLTESNADLANKVMSLTAVTNFVPSERWSSGSFDVWEVLLLYLLLGSNNFFRSMPELINILFCAHMGFYYRSSLSSLCVACGSTVGITPSTRTPPPSPPAYTC